MFEKKTALPITSYLPCYAMSYVYIIFQYLILDHAFH